MAPDDRNLFWNRENEVDEKWIDSVDDDVLGGETPHDGNDIVWLATYMRIIRAPARH